MSSRAKLKVLLLGLGLAVLALSACSWWFLETRGPAPALAASAPDFALTGHDGNKVALSSLLAGGPVVVSFYRGYW